MIMNWRKGALLAKLGKLVGVVATPVEPLASSFAITSSQLGRRRCKATQRDSSLAAATKV